jgi:oxygen-independent coproporphyrinogen-3 oxidase
MYSLYLHIPFCVHRCAYCDFNTYAGLETLIPGYVRALKHEIELVGQASRAELVMLPIHTIFFGGGTPSLLAVEHLEDILQTIELAFALQPGIEITLEANPGTLSKQYLTELRHLPVNRLSLGVQSIHLAELRLLERQHNFDEVVQSVKWARQAGFDNLNLDLIFGLPYQSLKKWQQTLKEVLFFTPEHISLYALTLEHGTPMHNWVQRGLMDAPDADLAADMYEWASNYLELHGYEQYEISNWARHDQISGRWRCKHNLQYWRGLPFLGLGAGAHGYAFGQRISNVLFPQAYIERMVNTSPAAFPASPANISRIELTREDEIGEKMMMGLRLVSEGVSDQEFFERFGVHLQDLYHSQIDKLTRQGLVEWDGERLRLSKGGRLLGNRVFREFI